jgi:NAD-dependent dihydropyrimidine dehydrogenase PreA subunit
MAYVIAEPCVGTKDTACVAAYPVDCIHPKKNATHGDGRPSFDEYRSSTSTFRAG